jgi:hypothetical protein
MRQRFVFDRAGLGTQFFPVWQTRRGLLAPLTKQRRRMLQRTTQLRIGQRGLRILPKRFAA